MSSDTGPVAAQFKKRKKSKTNGLLSFGNDDKEEGEENGAGLLKPTQRGAKARTPAEQTSEPDSSEREGSGSAPPRKFRSNPNSALPPPRVMTKAAIAAEAVAREKLQKEFLAVQEKVKNSEILIPFVFHEGTNIPGGGIKVNKGDDFWLFL